VAKRLLFSLAVLILLLVASEGCASFVLAWRDRDEGTGIAEQVHCEYDPLLGWVNLASFHAPDLYGEGLGLTTNQRRFRATAELSADARPIVCLGDSFTLGYGVGDESTYPALLARLVGTPTANMGQGGYGVDQAILGYLRDGVELDTEEVVLAFIAPDFDRITESRFDERYPKPCLRVVDGELELLEDPLPDEWNRLGAETAGLFDNLALTDLLRRLRRRGHRDEGTHEVPLELPYREVAELLLRDLIAAVSAKNADLTLALLPLRDRTAGNPAALMAWLRPFVESLVEPDEVTLLDLTETFDRLAPGETATLYLSDGHLNAQGNLRVAQTLADHLRAKRDQ